MQARSEARQQAWFLPRPASLQFAARIAICFLAVWLAVVFVHVLPAESAVPHRLQFADGILLAYLLVVPRWNWPAYLAAGFAALLMGGTLTAGGWKIGVLHALLRLFEVMLSAWLLRRRSCALPRFAAPAYLGRFVLVAFVLAPLATGLLYSIFAVHLLHESAASALLTWAVGDGLGIAATTPACVGILLGGFAVSRQSRTGWIYVAAAAVVTVYCLVRVDTSLLIVLYPLMILVLLRQGMVWASTTALLTSVASVYCTMRSLGPTGLMQSGVSLAPIGVLQLNLLLGTFTLYSISAVLDRHKTRKRELLRAVELHNLVMENSRDIIMLEDIAGNRSYVSAAAQNMVGLKPKELLRTKNLDLVHPDDLAKAQEVIHLMRSGVESATIECRVRKQDGNYMWVEASLKLVHDPVMHAPIGILYIVRDIQDRKQAEQDLQSAYLALEALAATDSLTQLANRRHFDHVLSTEWRRCQRAKQPLSTLLIDVDFFKAYNDTYGHLKGDNCLKEIAGMTREVATRCSDLVARFGGEEFAVILPNTSYAGAMQVAEEIRSAMEQLRLPHHGSPLGQVTISIGCATTVPVTGQRATHLLHQADEALYEAKRCGRNQVYGWNDNTVAREAELLSGS